MKRQKTDLDVVTYGFGLSTRTESTMANPQRDEHGKEKREVAVLTGSLPHLLVFLHSEVHRLFLDGD